MFRMIVTVTCLCIMATAITAQTPQSVPELLKSADTHLTNLDLDAALADVNKALELDPKSAAAYFKRFTILSQRNETTCSADVDKIIEHAPPSYSGIGLFYFIRGTCRLLNDNLDSALHDFNQAIANKRDEDEATFYNVRSYVHLVRGDVDAALSDFARSRELEPALPSPFYRRAVFSYVKGSFDEALTDFGRVIEQQPDYADAYTSRAIVCGLKGQIDLALVDLKKGMAIDPATVGPVRRNYCSPFVDLSWFMRKHKNNARAYELRGIFKLLQRNNYEATRDFKIAVQLDPQLQSEIDRISRVLQ